MILYGTDFKLLKFLFFCFLRLESVHCADKGNEKESLPVDEALGQTIRRLKSQGMTDVVERKLLRLREVILKLNNGRAR